MLHTILHRYKIFAFTLSKTNTNFYQIVVSMALHSNFYQKIFKIKIYRKDNFRAYIRRKYLTMSTPVIPPWRLC